MKQGRKVEVPRIYPGIIITGLHHRMNESKAVELMETLSFLNLQKGGEFTTYQYQNALAEIRDGLVLYKEVSWLLSECCQIVPLGRDLWYTTGFTMDDGVGEYEEDE